MARQPKHSPAKPLALIVRRGALRRFDALQRKTAGLPVSVIWDRRQTERRSSSESVPEDQRKGDRRQRQPFTWEIADFVLVADRPRKRPAGRRPVADRKSR